MNIKLLLTLCLSLIYFNVFADKFVLVSTDPSSETTTPIPGTATPFDSIWIFNSLTTAESSLSAHFSDSSIAENVTIYIREGVYTEAGIFWDVTTSHSNYKITITTYNNEKAIFDGIDLSTGTLGGNGATFFKLANKGERTNLCIDGLIIENYVNGIRLGEMVRDSSICEYDTTLFNSHNIIRNNIFRNIGNLFSTNTEQIGYSALGLSNSCNNTIDNNIFYKIENSEPRGPSLHPIYMTNYSHDNTIKNNYFYYASGTVIKLRNRCRNTTIDRNYFDQAGTRGFVESWHCNSTGNNALTIDTCNCTQYSGNGEGPSTNIRITNNVCTFQYPHYGNASLYPIQLFYDEWKDEDSTLTSQHSTFSIYGNFEAPTSNPICEDIVATSSGDIDGDGIEEVFTAFNYGDFCKIVRSEMGDEPYLSRALYTSTYWRVGGLTVNDFDGNGTDEIFVGFNAPNGSSRIYKGNGNSSILNFGLKSSHSGWKVTAMTSGNYRGSKVGKNEVFVGFVSTTTTSTYDTEIWKGDGINSAVNYNRISGHKGWEISAMTSGDYNNNGADDIFVGFNAQAGTSGYKTEVWKGNGATSATNDGKKYYSHHWIVRSLTSGDYDNNGSDEIYVGFNTVSTSSGIDQTQIWKGDGLNSITNLGKKYSSTSWKNGNLISGKLTGTQRSHLLSFYQIPNITQMHYGHGNGSLFNFGKYYQAEEITSCIFAKTTNSEYTTPELPTTQEHIYIYPNPANPYETVKISGISSINSIRIYSSNGQLLKTLNNQQHISLNEFNPGVYYLNILDQKTISTKKLIIR